LEHMLKELGSSQERNEKIDEEIMREAAQKTTGDRPMSAIGM